MTKSNSKRFAKSEADIDTFIDGFDVRTTFPCREVPPMKPEEAAIYEQRLSYKRFYYGATNARNEMKRIFRAGVKVEMGTRAPTITYWQPLPVKQAWTDEMQASYEASRREHETLDG